jgi:hypothetical protein
VPAQQPRGGFEPFFLRVQVPGRHQQGTGWYLVNCSVHRCRDERMMSVLQSPPCSSHFGKLTLSSPRSVVGLLEVVSIVLSLVSRGPLRGSMD